MPKHTFYTWVIIAVFIKLLLFSYAAVYVPQSKFLPDSELYLQSALTLTQTGQFAVPQKEGPLQPVYYRTPGYPFFLSLLHGKLKLPLRIVILFQIGLTFLAAWAVYKAAVLVDTRLAPLSALILLFDPAITVYSMIILTESLYLVLISFFMLLFILYLQHYRWKFLCLAAGILAAATYVRPVSYFLAMPVALFLCYHLLQKKCFGKARLHPAVFLLVVYGLLGIWQIRNHRHFNEYKFCEIDNATFRLEGIHHSYARSQDIRVKKTAPWQYYAQVSAKSIFDLMTRPASLKYFGSYPLKALGKIFSYPWVMFLLGGFMVGSLRVGDDKFLQFLLLVTLYFIGVSVGGALLEVTPRLRIAMMPFIAILTAYGWAFVRDRHNKSE